MISFIYYGYKGICNVFERHNFHVSVDNKIIFWGRCFPGLVFVYNELKLILDILINIYYNICQEFT